MSNITLLHKWNLHELDCIVCGIDFNELCGRSLKDKSIDINKVIDKAIRDKFGCSYEAFEKIAYTLLGYTPVIDDYEGHKYHLFAKQDHNGVNRVIIRKEVET
ncbi:MAG: hypothetical protein PUF37_00840 [Prevotellaceae bacterium]|nr:hypothetical protein [Prevotellaceae bacterium]